VDSEEQYLTFALGGESYAIGILAIKEIIEYEPLTVVPMMPEHVRGVINLRGAVVPVIDLHVRFGRPCAAATSRTCIVIVETFAHGEKQDIGVVVDAVNAVISIPDAAIEAPPALGGRARSPFIRGLGKINERFVILLDLDQVLSEQEALELASLGTAAPDPVATSPARS
jgi:purine-binding chemotaxis protein CheW